MIEYDLSIFGLIFILIIGLLYDWYGCKVHFMIDKSNDTREYFGQYEFGIIILKNKQRRGKNIPDMISIVYNVKKSNV